MEELKYEIEKFAKAHDHYKVIKNEELISKQIQIDDKNSLRNLAQREAHYFQGLNQLEPPAVRKVEFLSCDSR